MNVTKSKYPPTTVEFSELTKVQKRMFSPEKEKVVPGKGVYVTFFGANALHLSDGNTNILIDPYFSRDHFHRIDWPKKKRELYLNEDRIEGCLSRLNMSNLDAILLTHSHFDHSMDIGHVSRTFFAKRKVYPPIYGCESVAHVALGTLAPKESSEFSKLDRKKRVAEFRSLCKRYNIKLVNSNYEKTYPIGKGKFSVKFVKARHLEFPFPLIGSLLKGKIEKPLIPGGDIYDYKEGEIHSIIIKHKDFGNILIMGSANYISGQFKRLDEKDRPRAMILAAAGLVGARKIGKYNKEVAVPCSPAKVFFSHWDNFSIPLDEDMQWMRRISLLDEIDIDLNEIRRVFESSVFLPLLEGVKVL